MSVRWVVDLDHPDGHAVEMTAAEQKQHDADQTAGEEAAAITDANVANERMMSERLTSRMASALTMAAALDANTATAAQQRAALADCLRGIVRLTRITLDELDQAD